VGIKIRDGVIGLSDGRITSGNQVSSAKKLTLHGPDGHRFMIMTSGLRSLRDKTLAYLERTTRAGSAGGFRTMLDAVGAYCACLRRVADEDKAALEAAKLGFNLHSIVGGQLADDTDPALYLVYPEGNWIEVDERTPYLSIGATAYGKPILDRGLRFDSTMQHALKIAYLSFDSTRYSSADVGYPIDLATHITADRRWRTAQFDYDDLIEQRQWWNEHIKELASRLPDQPWLDRLVPTGSSTRLVVISDDKKAGTDR
jgi:putative proteasome-type protease